MDDEHAVSGRTTGVGDAEGDLRRHNCCGSRGFRGEGGGESRTRVSSSEMLLARRPKPLGGRMSGEGGDGERLGERGHGTLEMCLTALLEKVPLLRKWNLEAREDTRWRMETDTEDWEVEEIVDGECLRLGAGSLTTFGESVDLRMKDGMGMTVLYVHRERGRSDSKERKRSEERRPPVA
jgi:hypothetical protein